MSQDTEDNETGTPADILSDVDDTRGFSYIVLDQNTSSEVVAGMLVRRLVVGAGGKDILDIHVSYRDLAFLTRALIAYLHADTTLLGKTGNFELQWARRGADIVIKDLEDAYTELDQLIHQMKQLPYTDNAPTKVVR